MQARMSNPAAVLPGAMEAINGLYKASHTGGVPPTTLELVHLRASQINGCSPCVDGGARSAKKAGETDERLWLAAVMTFPGGRRSPFLSCQGEPVRLGAFGLPRL